MANPDALERVITLHHQVDEAVAGLFELHRDLLRCALGCTDCCIDEITVFQVEAALIEREHGELLRSGAAHSPGACAFLDASRACRIYAHRPYVCRTHGVPLRWEDYDDSDQPIECRDICALSDPYLDVTALEPTACWTLGPAEAQLRAAQQLWSGGGLDRIPLRALFRDEPVA